MNARCWSVGLIGLVVCFAGVWLSRSPVTAQVKDKGGRRPQWEYKIIRANLTWEGDSTKRLDRLQEMVDGLGKEGWELVAVNGAEPHVTQSQTTPQAGGQTKTTHTVQYAAKLLYHFKRMK